MSAKENLNPQQFFHGTAAELRPGSLIRPASHLPKEQTNYPSLSDPDYAYATKYRSQARTYAEHAQGLAGDHTASLVYEVQPTGSIEPDPNDEQAAVRSKDPWKVVRRLPAKEYGPNAE